MAGVNEIVLNSVTYELVAESQLPRGRRAYATDLRPSQESDARIRTARWKLSGPTGLSNETPNGFLGHDFSVNIETRYDNLITSVAARNTLSLSTSDPLSSASSALGGFALGAAALGGGATSSTAQNLTHMDEDHAQLFCHRGSFSTQVNIAAGSPSVTETVAHDATVKGVAVWFEQGRLGLGSTVAIQTRSAVQSTGSTYTDTQVSAADVFAKEMTVGTDRLWMVDADIGAGDENKVKFTLDDFASESNSFVVGDRRIPATGLGTLGAFTAVGSEVGAFSFTDAGKQIGRASCRERV